MFTYDVIAPRCQLVAGSHHWCIRFSISSLNMSLANRHSSVQRKLWSFCSLCLQEIWANADILHRSLQRIRTEAETKRAKAYSSQIVPVRKLPISIKPFRHNSLLKCAAQPKMKKQTTKPYIFGVQSLSNPYFGVQRHPRSLNFVTFESQCTTSY